MFVVQLYEYTLTCTALHGHAMVARPTACLCAACAWTNTVGLVAQTIYIFLLLAGLCPSACTNIRTHNWAVWSSCRSYCLWVSKWAVGVCVPLQNKDHRSVKWIFAACTLPPSLWCLSQRWINVVPFSVLITIFVMRWNIRLLKSLWIIAACCTLLTFSIFCAWTGWHFLSSSSVIATLGSWAGCTGLTNENAEYWWCQHCTGMSMFGKFIAQCEMQSQCKQRDWKNGPMGSPACCIHAYTCSIKRKWLQSSCNKKENKSLSTNSCLKK